jgi:hypothetical protein
MKTKVLSLHPYGVLFHAELDALNGFTTIVYDWKAGEVYDVNRFGYEVLRAIDSCQPVSVEQVINLMSSQKSKVEKFVNEMVMRNVIIEL